MIYGYSGGQASDTFLINTSFGPETFKLVPEKLAYQ